MWEIAAPTAELRPYGCKYSLALHRERGPGDRVRQRRRAGEITGTYRETERPYRFKSLRQLVVGFL